MPMTEPSLEKDPVLQTWMKAFPGTVKPKSEMSDALISHVRYPEDIFRVQRDVLSLYHVKNANAFYGGQDFWRVPRDPSTLGANAGAQPPYYYTLQLPGEKKASFSITTPFVPRGGRENLLAFAVVNSDPGEDYGKLVEDCFMSSQFMYVLRQMRLLIHYFRKFWFPSEKKSDSMTHFKAR